MLISEHSNSGLPRPDQISTKIDKVIEKCKQEEKIKYFLQRWMDSGNIREGHGISEAADKIHDYLTETHGFMTYMVIIYDPLHGGSNHWTHHDIEGFR